MIVFWWKLILVGPSNVWHEEWARVLKLQTEELCCDPCFLQKTCALVVCDGLLSIVCNLPELDLYIVIFYVKEHILGSWVIVKGEAHRANIHDQTVVVSFEKGSVCVATDEDGFIDIVEVFSSLLWWGPCPDAVVIGRRACVKDSQVWGEG